MTTPTPQPANAKAVATALDMLGSAYRGDWSGFDGRTLRNQLDDLSAALGDPEPFEARTWAATLGICPEARQWADHCDQRSDDVYGGTCDHVTAIFDEVTS